MINFFLIDFFDKDKRKNLLKPNFL